ncbi:MAG TPA: alpha/beta hydrolase [Dyella sp.]|uniref:dienelactone hydrolase family protein n=1 Tax=Dyella sp. TaxID=1869338 RepID=UPI002F937397
MPRPLLSSLLVMLAFLPSLIAHAADVAAVTLKASDGVTIHARYYHATTPKALILLFHQAGSSKDEYAQIAPRLVEAGYSALAIDQRSGGDLFGPNETAMGLGRKADYLEAKKDLDAAVTWGAQKHLPLMLWGSSYSSSLIFIVAAEHPDVKAVLAFSPGEYFDNKSLVRNAASHVSAPVYVTSSDSSEEIEAARSIVAASPSKLKEQYVPRSGGVHGSSTLIETKDPKGAADNWKAVLAFLGKVPLSR